MKKMLFWAAAAVFTLSACSDDDGDDNDNNNNNNEASIVGVWTSQEVDISVITNDTIAFIDTTYMTAAGTWNFTANGELITSVDATKPDALGVFDDDTLYYTVNGTMLMIKEEANEPNDSAEVFTLATLTNTELVITGNETETDSLGNTTESNLSLSFIK